MAPTHGEIVKELGGGWAVAWDATVTDPEARRAMDAAVQASTEALRTMIGAPPVAIPTPTIKRALQRI